jgi:diguanylate cyclase (GGDEF)-like protein
MVTLAVDRSAVRVLLVDDDEDDLLLTRSMLSDCGEEFVIEWASTPAAGLDKLTTGAYDVALVDHNLGGSTGIELLGEACAHGCRIPIIMLTGQPDRETDLRAMRAGAADYLVKGRVTADLLERAIRYARERHRLLQEIQSRSLTDELTGLSNRRAFFALAEQQVRLLHRRGASGLLVYADVDGLKQANDTIGHDAGDRLLVDAAHVLRATFRHSDVVARLGGDEFTALAGDAEEDHLQVVLDRLQYHIDRRNAEVADSAPRLSISVGALCFKASRSTRLPELMAEADALMMECKRKRRAAMVQR